MALPVVGPVIYHEIVFMKVFLQWLTEDSTCFPAAV